MKLHMHRAEKDGLRFRAYTRDRSGSLLKKNFTQPNDHNNIVFRPSDWTYEGVESIDFGEHSEFSAGIKGQLAKLGFGFVKISAFPYPIFVFSVDFDHSNATLYSLDGDAARFEKTHNLISLSPKGRHIGYQNLHRVGEISGYYYDDLQKLGINLPDLTRLGFFVDFHTSLDPQEHLQRYLQRMMQTQGKADLNRKLRPLGIEIEDIKVNLDRNRPIYTTPSVEIDSKHQDSFKPNTQDRSHFLFRLPRSIRILFSVLGAFAAFVAFVASLTAVLDFFSYTSEDLFDLATHFLR